MNTYIIYKEVKNNNTEHVSDALMEMQRNLFNATADGDLQHLEDNLNIGYEQLKRTLRDNPEFKDSMAYQIGMLAGMLESYDRIYSNRKQQAAIHRCIMQAASCSEIVTEGVFAKLMEADRRNEWISLTDLSLALNTDPDYLSYIMNFFAMSRAVDVDFAGSSFNYRITPGGKRYYLGGNQ